jgi:hypothetical protein
MERFVSQPNIDLYRKLADSFTDELQRRVIFKLLAEQQERFRQSGQDPDAPSFGTNGRLEP